MVIPCRPLEHAVIADMDICTTIQQEAYCFRMAVTGRHAERFVIADMNINAICKCLGNAGVISGGSGFDKRQVCQRHTCLSASLSGRCMAVVWFPTTGAMPPS